jgi:hypothetical protein
VNRLIYSFFEKGRNGGGALDHHCKIVGKRMEKGVKAFFFFKITLWFMLLSLYSRFVFYFFWYEFEHKPLFFYRRVFSSMYG